MNAPFLPPIARRRTTRCTLIARCAPGLAQRRVRRCRGSVDRTTARWHWRRCRAPGRLLAEPSGTLRRPGAAAPCGLAAPTATLVLLDRRAAAPAAARSLRLRVRPWPCIAPARRARCRSVRCRIAGGCGVLLLCVPALHRVIVLDAAERRAARRVAVAPRRASRGRRCMRAVTLRPASRWWPTRAGGVHLCCRHGRSLRFIGGLGAVRALARRCARARSTCSATARTRCCVVDVGSGEIAGTAPRPAQVAADFAALPIERERRRRDRHRTAVRCRRPDSPHGSTCTAPPLERRRPPQRRPIPSAAPGPAQPLDSEIAGLRLGPHRAQRPACRPARASASRPRPPTRCSPMRSSPSRSRWRAAAAGCARRRRRPLPCAAPTACCTRRPAATCGSDFDWAATRAARRASTASASTSRASACAATCRRCSAPTRSPPSSPTAGSRSSTAVCASIETQIDEQARAVRSAGDAGRARGVAARDFLGFLAGWVGVDAARPPGRSSGSAACCQAGAAPVRLARHAAGLAPRRCTCFLGLDRWAGFAPQPACLRALRRTAARRCTRSLAAAAPRARALPAAPLDGARSCPAVRRGQALGRAHRQPQPARRATPTLQAGGGSDGAQLGVTQLKTHAGPAPRPVPRLCAPAVGVRAGRPARARRAGASAARLHRRRDAGARRRRSWCSSSRAFASACRRCSGSTP